MKFVSLFFACLFLSACSVPILYNYTVYGSPLSFEYFLISKSLDPHRAADPTSLKVAIYAFYLAPKADCLNPTPLIDYGTSPFERDMYLRQTLFSGNPGSGYYSCIIVKIGDVLKFRPDANASPPVVCTDEEHSQDTYRVGSGGADLWKDLNGNYVNARGTQTSPVDDVITYFLSTEPSLAVEARGLSSYQATTLSAQVKVPGESTMYLDYRSSVADSGGSCGLVGGVGIGVR